jgi:RimJ/RimL family protein N-acetyltransferase
MAFRHPVDLSGRFARLVPLRPEHADGLLAVAGDPEIWTYMVTGRLSSPDRMAQGIEELLRREAAGTDLPFTVLARPGDVPVGMTRFLEIDRPHRRAEIGGTWYGRPYRRTPVNTECKLLLLRYAFEVEGARRVQLKTDLRNLRSQRAIERLGATREGVLRSHMVMPDGYARSSVVYSVIDAEWPAIRARLEAMLARPWPPT